MRATAVLTALLLIAGCRSEQSGGGGFAQGGSGPLGGTTPEMGGGGAAPEGGSAPTLCNSGLVYTGADLACMNESCCDAANDCTLDGTDVDGCRDCLIEGGERCQALGECHRASCLPPEGLCGTTLEHLYVDPRIDACMNESCCDEITYCMADADLCMECLADRGGPQCDPIVSCATDHCLTSEGICDSGLSYGDGEANQCLGDNCCAELSACTMDGTDVDSCVACFQEGGGPICDDAQACIDSSGCIR